MLQLKQYRSLPIDRMRDIAPCDASSSVMPVARAVSLISLPPFKATSFTSDRPAGASGLLNFRVLPEAFDDHPAAGRSKVADSPLIGLMISSVAPTFCGSSAGSTGAGNFD